MRTSLRGLGGGFEGKRGGSPVALSLGQLKKGKNATLPRSTPRRAQKREGTGHEPPFSYRRAKGAPRQGNEERGGDSISCADLIFPPPLDVKERRRPPAFTLFFTFFLHGLSFQGEKGGRGGRGRAAFLFSFLFSYLPRCSPSEKKRRGGKRLVLSPPLKGKPHRREKNGGKKKREWDLSSLFSSSIYASSSAGKKKKGKGGVGECDVPVRHYLDST